MYLSVRGVGGGVLCLRDLPVTHGSIGGLHDERFLLAFPPQLLHVVLELGVLRREDPCFGNKAVFLRLALYHSS